MNSTKYNLQSVVRTREFFVIYIIMKLAITFMRLRVTVFIICVETREASYL